MKKRIIACVLLASLLVPVLVSPGLASFSDVAKQNTSVIFAGTDFSDTQKQKILDNFDNLPSDAKNWTSNNISTRLLVGVNGVTAKQKIQLTSNVLENISVFGGQSPPSSNAGGDDGGAYVGSTENDGGSSGDADEEDPATAEGRDSPPTLIERIIAIPINGLTKALEKIFGIDSIPALFFAQDAEGNPTPGMEVGGVFSMEEWEKIIKPWFTAMQAVAWLLMGITICVQGVKIAGSDSSPSLKADLQDKLRQWVLAAIFIALTPFVVQFMFDVNLAAIDAAAKYANYGDFWEAVADSDGVILAAIVNFCMICLAAWFNVRYLLRKVMVMFLIILAPLVAWSSAFQKKNVAFNLWMGELTSNIAIQTADAWVFAVITGGLFSLSSGSGFSLESWWVKLALLAFVHPVANLVTKLICGFFGLIGVDEDQITNKGLGMISAPAKMVGNIGSAMVGGAAGATTAYQAIRGTSSDGGNTQGNNFGGSATPGISTDSIYPMPTRSNVSGQAFGAGTGITPQMTGIGVTGVPSSSGSSTSGAGVSGSSGASSTTGVSDETGVSGSRVAGNAGGTDAFGKAGTSYVPPVQRVAQVGRGVGQMASSTAQVAGAMMGQYNPDTNRMMDHRPVAGVAGGVAGSVAGGVTATVGGIVGLGQAGNAGEFFGYDENASPQEKLGSIKAGTKAIAKTYLPPQPEEKHTYTRSVDQLRYN